MWPDVVKINSIKYLIRYLRKKRMEGKRRKAHTQWKLCGQVEAAHVPGGVIMCVYAKFRTLGGSVTQVPFFCYF